MLTRLFLTALVTVVPIAPSSAVGVDSLSITNGTGCVSADHAEAAQVEVWVDLAGPIQSFVYGVCHDGSELDVVHHSMGADLAALEPDLYRTDVTNDYFQVLSIMSFFAVALLPSGNQHLATIDYELLVPGTHSLTLCDYQSITGPEPSFVVGQNGSSSVLAFSGTATITSLPDPCSSVGPSPTYSLEVTDGTGHVNAPTGCAAVVDVVLRNYDLSGPGVQALTYAVCHDPAALDIAWHSRGLDLVGLNPSFCSVEVDAGRFQTQCVFSIFQGPTLPPGTRHVATIAYDILTPGTHPLTLCDYQPSSGGASIVPNVAIFGSTIAPALLHGSVTSLSDPCELSDPGPTHRFEITDAPGEVQKVSAVDVFLHTYDFPGGFVEGYHFAACFDSSALAPTFVFDGHDVAPLERDFYDVDLTANYVQINCVFSPAVGGTYLLPPGDRHLATIGLGVSAPGFHDVTVCDYHPTGATPFPSNIQIAGVVIEPDSDHGVISTPIMFQVGDANVDGNLDLADAVRTLDILFGSVDLGSCPAALDINDDDQIDLGDPIYTLSYVFSMGPGPTLGCVAEAEPGDPLGCEFYEPCL